jgi:hypothetical protein
MPEKQKSLPPYFALILLLLLGGPAEGSAVGSIPDESADSGPSLVISIPIEITVPLKK